MERGYTESPEEIFVECQNELVNAPPWSTSMAIAQFPEIRPSGNLRGKKGEPVLKIVELELWQSLPPQT